jgi:hypothetical protein
MGNSGPRNTKVRSEHGGVNLFLSSIVARDPDTGTLSGEQVSALKIRNVFANEQQNPLEYTSIRDA